MRAVELKHEVVELSAKFISREVKYGIIVDEIKIKSPIAYSVYHNDPRIYIERTVNHLIEINPLPHTSLEFKFYKTETEEIFEIKGYIDIDHEQLFIDEKYSTRYSSFLKSRIYAPVNLINIP